MNDKIISILKSILETEQLTPNDSLLESGIDSLGIEELLYEIEKQFGVVLQVEDILDSPKIEQLASLVSSKIVPHM